MAVAKRSLSPALLRMANTAEADADLLGRFVRTRDEAAFAALVERHGPMVLGVCRRALGDVHAAEDGDVAAIRGYLASRDDPTVAADLAAVEAAAGRPPKTHVLAGRGVFLLRHESTREVAMSAIHTTIDSPVGELTLVADEGTLTGLYFRHHWYRPAAAALGQRSDEGFGEARTQLAEYFAGRRTAFDLPLDFSGTEFQKKAWAALLTIPFGVTRTYAQIARQIGRPAAVRAVGAANGRNPLSIVAPCHRVIGSNGELVGYGGGLSRKRRLLDLEGRTQTLSLFGGTGNG